MINRLFCLFLYVFVSLTPLLGFDPLELSLSISTHSKNFITAVDALKDDANISGYVIGMNIGQGNLFIQRYKQGEQWFIKIIDAGTIQNEQTSFVHELKGQGNRSELLKAVFNNVTLSAIIITHTDSDHYNKIVPLLEFAANCSDDPNRGYIPMKISPELTVLIGGVSSNQKVEDSCNLGIKKYNEKMQTLLNPSFIYYDNSKPENRFSPSKTSDELKEIYLLECKTPNTVKDNNSFSLILTIREMLYAGDANTNTCNDSDIQSFAEEKKNSPKGGVLSHHGAETQGSGVINQSILKRFELLFGIISVGTGSKFHHPKKEMFGIGDVTLLDSWKGAYPFLANVTPHKMVFFDGENRGVQSIPVAIYETSMPEGIPALCFKFHNSEEVFVYDHDNEHKWLELIKPCVPQSGETHSYKEEEAA
jgi:hypothetical protein